MGVKDPKNFIRYQILENKNIPNRLNISFNFVIGMILGALMVLMFVYVL
jgi:hypothetical protein